MSNKTIAESKAVDEALDILQGHIDEFSYRMQEASRRSEQVSISELEEIMLSLIEVEKLTDKYNAKATRT